MRRRKRKRQLIEQREHTRFCYMPEGPCYFLTCTCWCHVGLDRVTGPEAEHLVMAQITITFGTFTDIGR